MSRLFSETHVPVESAQNVCALGHSVSFDPDLRKSYCWPADREISTDRAHTLGAYQSVTRRDGAKTRVVFTHDEESVISATCRALENLGLRRRSEERANPRVIEVNSPKLAEYLREVTSNNTKLPWIFLGTSAERLAYLQSFLSHSGSFSGRFFRVESSRCENLLIQVACLFGEFGIAPSVYSTARGTLLQLSAAEELDHLAKLQILSVTECARLTEILGTARATDRIQWRQKYAQAMALKPEFSAAAAARELGLHPGVVANWYSGLTSPKSVQRMTEIARLRSTWRIPFAESVAILFRQCELPQEVAEVVGAQFSHQELVIHLSDVVNFCAQTKQAPSATKITELVNRRKNGLAFNTK